MKKHYSTFIVLYLLWITSTLAQGTTAQTITFPTISNKYADNADFLLGATAQSGLTVTYTVTAGGSIASVSGDTLKLSHTAVGTVTVTANQSGNGTFAAAPAVNRTFMVSKRSQTISFIPIANQYVNSIPFKLNATATSTLPVTFTVVSGPATISNDTLTVTGTAGTVVVSASQAGNNTYNAAVTLSKSFLVSKRSQAITFPVISTKTPDAANFKMNATASSGLAVAYTVSGVATLAGTDSIALTGAEGTVTIVSNQAGNGTYLAAPALTTTFTVAKKTQGITFPSLSAKYVNAANFKLLASTTSGLTVSYAVSGPATLVGADSVSLSGTEGTVTVIASQAGNGAYKPATSVTKTFVVTQIPQTITFSNILNKNVNAPNFKLLCSASSGLPITYTVSGPAQLITGDSIQLDGTPGTVTVVASQLGNANYDTAVSVTKVFTVSKVAQTIKYKLMAVKYLNETPFAIAPTSTSGLSVTGSIISGPATISNNVITLTGSTGNVILALNQAGNAVYTAAPTVLDTFEVAKAAQNITITNVPNKLTTDPKFKVKAVTSSGLAVTLTVVSGPAIILDDTIFLTGTAGTVTIGASQSGNAVYNAAPAMTKSFTVNQAPQTITFPLIPAKVVTSPAIKLAATTSSGLSISYNVTGPAFQDGDSLRLDGTTGTVNVTAIQLGNSTYKPATSVTRSFVVSKAAQSITWSAIAMKYANSSDFSVSATSSAGLTITYSIVSGPATISGSTVHLTGGTGVVVIRASQAGNTEYLAKTSDKSIYIYPAPVLVSNPNNNGNNGLSTNHSNTSSLINEGDVSFVAYPNPAGNTQDITIEASNTVTAVRVYDITGKEVVSIVPEADTKRVTLNMNGQHTGIYLIKVQNGNQESTARLLIQ